MKTLIFVCVLLVAEAAKLQGYQPPLHGSTGISLSTLSGATAPTQNEFISGTPQHGQFLSSSNGVFGSQPQQSFAALNQQTPQQGFTSGVVSGQPSLNTQVQGTAVHGAVFPIVHHQQNSLGIDAGDSLESCPDGLIRHFDGSCIIPEILRNVFVYAAPEQEPKPTSPPPNIPLPKLEHNIVFIRTPEQGAGVDPIIVPPPQKKNVIYVLNKQEDQEQKVIEVPAPEPKTPEVFFVNYADGETPTLPDGIDFETALNSAIHSEGQIIGGSNGLIQSLGENSLGVTSTLDNGVVVNGNPGQTFSSNEQFTGLNGNVAINNGQFSGFNGNIAPSNGQSLGFNGNVVTGTSPRPHQLYRAP